eukprot:403332384
MGKASKSVAYVSDKKTKLEIKKQQLQKVKKVGGAIKKTNKDKSKEDQLKTDYEELKALLRLDASTANDNESMMDDVDSGKPNTAQERKNILNELKKKKKLSTKKRRYLQLLQSNPQRDENPKDLTQNQIDSAKKTLKDNKLLTRGQKKRLKSKEKFINQRILEGRANETHMLHQSKLQKMKKEQKEAASLKKQQTQGTDSMMDVSMTTNNTSLDQKSKQKQPANKFGDFSGMSSLLDTIQTQTQKQIEQQQKHKSSKKQQELEAQAEKERLQKIIGLNSFHENSLDTLFLHVNNTINMKTKQ